jgi:hypothetical protein
MDCPASLSIAWSEEPRPLGTGGGIRRAADFLSADEDCVVLAGDMLLDFDLGRLLARHRASGRDVTLLLRDDGRGADFGTIGVDAGGHVTRIGKNLVAGKEAREADEAASGLFTGLRIFSKRALCDWPDDEVFEDLRDWLVPGILERGLRVGAEILAAEQCVWEPVGTPAEYLSANLAPPALPSLGGSCDQWAGDIRVAGDAHDVLVGAHSEISPDARLERVVVWEDECVPSGFAAQDGVIASGRFHDCRPDPAATRVNP